MEIDSGTRKGLASLLKFWSSLRLRASKKGADREFLLNILASRAAADSLSSRLSVREFMELAEQHFADAQVLFRERLPDWLPGPLDDKVKLLEQRLEALESKVNASSPT